jgi:nitroimidazol reductase NimA-like FMN-containing flavoprotein (pyridoxamine 5'-phosphate oxidase superfamily)
MSEEEAWSFVAQSRTGILTTLRCDGFPISLPVWFVCIDRTIFTETRGKKISRVHNDSRVAFLVEDGETWGQLRAVHLSGSADVLARDSILATRVGEELAHKYSSSRMDMSEAAAQAYGKMNLEILRITPDDRVLKWDNRRMI